ncbi:HET-domain-containing protein [Jackrogersella minutella]|nr:HET-domain-containing protein [Jackrogersella minutella]
MEQSIQNHHCAICNSILDAFNERGQLHTLLRSWPTRRIFIYLTGPFYLDREFDHNGTVLPRRPDISNPDYIVINMFLNIEVKALPYSGPEGDIGEPSFTNRVGQVDVATDQVLNAPIQFTITPQFKMKYSNENTPVPCSIEEWEVPFSKIELIKGWLKHCSEIHGKQCSDIESRHGMSIGARLPKGFRVIDTQGMNIIQPDDFVRYVALSYMWSGVSTGNIQLEKSNVDALETRDSIRIPPIPDIISDVIALCRELGERYLWVDRLCVFQDDQDTKPGRINAMDRIYSLSTFAIIAALNTRDGVGLPGFTNRPRHWRSSVWSPPHAAEVEAQGFEVANNIGNVERLLSERRLFITEHQVAYECCQGQASELLTWTASANPESWTNHHEEALEPRGVDGTSGFYDYCAWVKDYSSRQLSFGADILNAFAGIGNALSAVFNSRMLYGLPKTYLGQCLLWTTSGVTCPRGELYFLNTARIVYFHYQDPEKGLRRLAIKERWIGDEISIEDLSRSEKLPALKGKHFPGEWRTNQHWRDCPQNPWQTFDRQTLDPNACKIAAMLPGSLVFNTTVASLGVDHLQYTDVGESVGILSTMVFSWLEKYTLRSKYSFFEQWNKMWLLDVMLVERLSCQPFVARGIAVRTVRFSTDGISLPQPICVYSSIRQLNA